MEAQRKYLQSCNQTFPIFYNLDCRIQMFWRKYCWHFWNKNLWTNFTKSKKEWRPGPLAPPGRSLPMRNITARSYSCTTWSPKNNFTSPVEKFWRTKSPWNRQRERREGWRGTYTWKMQEGPFGSIGKYYSISEIFKLIFDKDNTKRAKEGRIHKSPCYLCLLSKCKHWFKPKFVKWGGLRTWYFFQNFPVFLMESIPYPTLPLPPSPCQWHH